jgi:hypothetical protein
VCFIIFYKSAAIELKIKRICDAFSANRYDLSNLNQSLELEKQEKDNLKEMLDVSILSMINVHCPLFLTAAGVDQDFKSLVAEYQLL